LSSVVSGKESAVDSHVASEISVATSQSAASQGAVCIDKNIVYYYFFRGADNHSQNASRINSGLASKNTSPLVSLVEIFFPSH
jgi:hypothetical protein